MHFLETATFWVWIVTTILLLALIFLSRHKLKDQLQGNEPPRVGSLLILAILLAILNLRAIPTGDEPHYLIMIQSLLRDGDFDLRNNYQRMDYLEYYPTVIPDPHVTIVGEHWYPVHGIGLPLLLIPFFALGGRVGVVIIFVLMTVVGIRVLWSILQSAGFGPKAAASTTLTSCLMLPLVSLSGQIFPEVPAFLLVALAVQAVIAPTLTIWKFAGFLISIVFLPWLHPKYTIVAISLLLSMAITHHDKSAVQYLAIASGSFIASVSSLIFLTNQWYGVPVPGAAIMMAKAPFGEKWLIPLLGNFFVKPWVGLTGALFDQQSGLFMANPIFILAVPGWILLWFRKRFVALLGVLIFASVYLPVGVFGVWYGGFSNPARLLTPAVPALAFGIASLIDTGERRVWRFFSLLALPSFVHAYLVMTLPSFTRYGDPISQHNYFIGLFEKSTRMDMTPLFPSFRNISPATWLTTGVYMTVIIMITFLLVPHKIKDEQREVFISSDL
jgi:hypothetical protein